MFCCVDFGNAEDKVLIRRAFLHCAAKVSVAVLFGGISCAIVCACALASLHVGVRVWVARKFGATNLLSNIVIRLNLLS